MLSNSLPELPRTGQWEFSDGISYLHNSSSSGTFWKERV